MALSQSVASELLEAFRAGEGVDLIRESVRLVMQDLIEVDVAEQIGAGRYERTDSRTTQRNGSRPKAGLDPGRGCGAGDPEAASGLVLPRHLGAAPPDRPGPVCGGDGGLGQRGLHPRGRRPGRCAGDRVGHLQVRGVAICAGLDEQVEAFRTRTLHHTTFPYVFLDATYLHVAPHRPGHHDGGGGRDRRHRQRRPGDPRRRRRRLRGRGVLARLPAHPARARPVRGAAGDLRPTRRPGRRAGPPAAKRHPPALPGPLRPQPPRPGPQVPQGHGRRGVPHRRSPNPTPTPPPQAWDQVRDQLAATFPKIGP